MPGFPVIKPCPDLDSPDTQPRNTFAFCSMDSMLPKTNATIQCDLREEIYQIGAQWYCIRPLSILVAIELQRREILIRRCITRQLNVLRYSILKSDLVATPTSALSSCADRQARNSPVAAHLPSQYLRNTLLSRIYARNTVLRPSE